MTENFSPEIVVHAYSLGYFPMPSGPLQEIGWFKPDPRTILPLDQFHTSRSFAKFLRHTAYRATINQDFSAVINACASRPQTWINSPILKCYTELHALGYAHSVEVWDAENLVGGIYGIALGKVFFAESMVSLQKNGSKFGLKFLVDYLRTNNFQLLEVQFMTNHLKSLGAVEISDAEYMKKLTLALEGERSQS